MSSRSDWTEARPRWVALAVWLMAAAGGCRPAAASAGPVDLHIATTAEDADADVYVDGHYVGQVRALGGDTLGTVKLTPGQHRVEIRKPGRFSVKRTVVVDADSPPRLELAAELLPDPQ